MMSFRSLSNVDKLVVGLAAVLLLVAAVGLAARFSEPGDFFYPLRTYFSGSVSYVVDVSQEVALLEEDLAEIDAQLEEGTLTSDEAAEAQERIVARIDRINSIIAEAEKGELTPAMRAMLLDTLSRLGGILTKYRDSLAMLEEVAGVSISASRPTLNVRGGTGGRGPRQSVATVIADAAQALEELIEEVTDEEIPDVVFDETASSTDEAATTTEEMAEEETTPPVVIPPVAEEDDTDEETAEDTTATGTEAADDTEEPEEAEATTTEEHEDETPEETATSTESTATST